MISDFKKNTENNLRTNARERSDRAGEGAVERFVKFEAQNHVIWCTVGVASFLVLGGGGKTPKCTDKYNICTYIARASEASERLRNIYFQDSKYICIYNVIYTINAVSFNYLWYGAIYTILYWQDTKIKKNLWICERAQRPSLNVFDIFTI